MWGQISVTEQDTGTPVTQSHVVVQSLSHIPLCDSMDYSTPGFPVPHYLLEFAQTHVHYVELVHSVFQVYYIPGGSDGKESGCSEGDPGSIRKSERCPGEGNDNPLQYACLENSMDRGAWRATVHGGHRVGHD